MAIAVLNDYINEPGDISRQDYRSGLLQTWYHVAKDDVAKDGFDSDYFSVIGRCGGAVADRITIDSYQTATKTVNTYIYGITAIADKAGSYGNYTVTIVEKT